MNPVTPTDGFQYFGMKPAAPKPELNMETFMKLLTVQLINQNPLEPMNDRDFFAQMAQLGQVEGLDNVQSSIDMSQAASLIGKTVTAVRPFTDTGQQFDSLVTGRVEQVTIKNGERILGIRDTDGGIVEVKLSSIQQITG